MEKAIPLPSLQAELPLSADRSRRNRRRRLWVNRLPWTVYGYIAAEVFRVMLLSVLAISLVYATMAAYQTVRSGIQLTFIWPLILSTVAYPLYFSVPLSFLFAVTLVLGRLASDLEVNALRTHGISHVHVYAPVLGLGVVLTVLSVYVNGWVVPRIHYQRRNLQAYVLKQIESLGSGVNRTILLPDGEGTLWVGAYDGPELERVRVDLVPDRELGLVPSIREHLPEKLPTRITILANRGRIEVNEDRRSMVLNLRSVQVLIPQVVRGGASAGEVFHQWFTVTEDVVIPLSFMDKLPGTKDRTNVDLIRYLRRLKLNHGPEPDPRAGEAGLALASYQEENDEPREKNEGLERKIASAATELHRRQAFAFSCLTFPLLGVSLSLLLERQSRIVPFFFGNLTVIGLYFPLLMVAVAVGDAGYMPWLVLTVPNLALLALGAYLTRKVVRR